MKELKPCGTIGAWSRHRRAGEPIDLACRAAWNAYTRSHRAGQVVASKARTPQSPAVVALEAAARTRLPSRFVALAAGTVPLGVLAGTRAQHPYLPGGDTSTSCLVCFGWCDDPRHAAWCALPPVGVR